jgi:hypothetical protein
VADQLRAGLGKLLDQYDERRRADLAREKKSKDDDAAFLARFAELRRDVVRPVFQEAGALLAERGHEFGISEQEFAAGGGNGSGSAVSEAAITFHIDPRGMESPLHADDHVRALSITTRHYNKTVWINSGKSQDAGGVAGAKGAYELERIDRQLVEEALIRFIGGILAS